MYRNRLTRAYLRTSRPRDARAADLFTDFDNGDDLPTGGLMLAVTTDLERTQDRNERLHVVNMTLNLVSRTSLASGYNSSPAVTFLRPRFNARLGWWLGTIPARVARRRFSCRGRRSGCCLC